MSVKASGGSAATAINDTLKKKKNKTAIRKLVVGSLAWFQTMDSQCDPRIPFLFYSSLPGLGSRVNLHTENLSSEAQCFENSRGLGGLCVCSAAKVPVLSPF